MKQLEITTEQQHIIEDFINDVFPRSVTWNDLMPVVEKIEGNGWRVDITDKNECSVFADHTNNSNYHHTHCQPDKMESVLLAVIRFISTNPKKEIN